jgi:hypothetical protein
MKLDQSGAKGLTVMTYVVQLPEDARHGRCPENVPNPHRCDLSSPPN